MKQLRCQQEIQPKKNHLQEKKTQADFQFKIIE